MDRIAVLFTGQGAQHVGMGKDMYDNIPVCRELFDMGEKIRRGTITQCFSSDDETLKLTENTQPCLFLTDLACALALKERGINADFSAGFSLGEIAAIAYAGILSYEDAFRLVCERGKSMALCAAEHPGAMSAVLRLSNDTIEAVAKRFENVYPVNYNCPGQLSVAGAEDEMPSFNEAVKEAGGRVIPIAVSGAFHTPFMEKAGENLRTVLSSLEVKSPQIPVIANMNAKPYPDDTAGIIDTVSLQVSNPVRFEDTLRYLYDNGVRIFIEAGAGKTLSGFVKKTLPEDVRIYNVTDMESLEAAAAELS